MVQIFTSSCYKYPVYQLQTYFIFIHCYVTQAQEKGDAVSIPKIQVITKKRKIKMKRKKKFQVEISRGI
jgi:hypothetical protein